MRVVCAAGGGGVADEKLRPGRDAIVRAFCGVGRSARDPCRVQWKFQFRK